MNFLVPTGIGDSVWALHKIQAVRDKQDPGGLINVTLTGGTHFVDSRALDFVRRFDFVTSVTVKSYGIHAEGGWHKEDGTYNYLPDGLYDFEGNIYCALIPNAALEHGTRLEAWLPEYPINWDIWKHFRISDAERKFGDSLHHALGDYAVFYPGPLHGNTEDGHNRNALWTPQNWIDLAARIHDEFGLPVVVVGASYDMGYYEWVLRPSLGDAASYWHNLIGATNLGQLWSVTNRAKFVVSYQAGVGIVSTYLGTPTAIFWRPVGDSISPSVYLSFDERMASAWVPPTIIASGKHCPLIYGRNGVDSVMIWAARWVDGQTTHRNTEVLHQLREGAGASS